MKPRLIRTPTIQPDESLSSWLTRTALLHGCEPLVVGWHVWGKYRVWTVDFERSMSIELLEKLAQATGVDIDRLDEALLIHNAKLQIPKFNPDNGIWPWVLCQGSRNRKKTIGQPYCPQCLNEKHGYLRREWRMAWATTCTHHQVLLQDRCPECQFLFNINKLSGLEKFIGTCSQCKCDLRQYLGITTQSPFQIAANKALESGYASYADLTLEAPEWFAVARAFILMLRRAARQPSGSFARIFAEFSIDANKIILPKTAGTFEWLPIDERHHLLQYCFTIMQHSLAELTDLAYRHGLTSNALLYTVGVDNFPITLQPLLHSLPTRIKVLQQREPSTKPLSEAQVMRKWARLQRKVDRLMLS